MKTADICDQFGPEVEVVPLPLRSFGARRAFAGAIVTVRVWEDNGLVRQLLAAPGEGKLLVIDGGGSTRCALVGDQVAGLASGNGWQGVVVIGCVRDAEALATLPLGVLALGTSPRPPVRAGAGAHDVAIDLGGVAVRDGMFLYADADGCVVSHQELGQSR